ncbi:MAG: hypothetical protein ACKVJG_27480 [Candidatus Latescibacterota bacterium]|jgi:hypothetical protein
MLAKILGILLVVWGAVLAVELIFPVIGSIFAAVALVAMGIIATGALYLGKRWLSGESVLGKIVGVLALVVGVVVGAKAVLGAVVGVLGAIVLAVKIAAVGAMLYIGWGWFKSGEFRLPWRRNYA